MGNIKDLYIIKWLLQNSEEPRDNIDWERNEYGRYFTSFYEGKEKVKVSMSLVQARPMARIVITLASPGLGEVSITEPLQSVFALRRKYDSEDEKEVADTMRQLLNSVARRHAQKELKEIENEEERKQGIYQRLLFGNTPDN